MTSVQRRYYLAPLRVLQFVLSGRTLCSTENFTEEGFFCRREWHRSRILSRANLRSWKKKKREKWDYRKIWKSSGVGVALAGGQHMERGLISVSSKCSAHRQCVTVHRVDVWIQEREAGVWSLMRLYQSSGFFCEFWVTHERDSVIKHNPKRSLHWAQLHVWFQNHKRRRTSSDAITVHLLLSANYIYFSDLNTRTCRLYSM